MQPIKYILSVAILAAGVAQAMPLDEPPCVGNCFKEAITASGCKNILDVACFCKSDKFESAARSCAMESCPELLPQSDKIRAKYCHH